MLIYKIEIRINNTCKSNNNILITEFTYTKDNIPADWCSSPVNEYLLWMISE